MLICYEKFAEKLTVSTGIIVLALIIIKTFINNVKYAMIFVAVVFVDSDILN